MDNYTNCFICSKEAKIEKIQSNSLDSKKVQKENAELDYIVQCNNCKKYKISLSTITKIKNYSDKERNNLSKNLRNRETDFEITLNFMNIDNYTKQ